MLRTAYDSFRVADAGAAGPADAGTPRVAHDGQRAIARWSGRSATPPRERPTSATKSNGSRFAGRCRARAAPANTTAAAAADPGRSASPDHRARAGRGRPGPPILAARGDLHPV